MIVITDLKSKEKEYNEFIMQLISCYSRKEISDDFEITYHQKNDSSIYNILYKKTGEKFCWYTENGCYCGYTLCKGYFNGNNHHIKHHVHSLSDALHIIKYDNNLNTVSKNVQNIVSFVISDDDIVYFQHKLGKQFESNEELSNYLKKKLNL